MNIRKRTFLIVCVGCEYLVGWNIVMNRPNFSTSPWDAWRTRDREIAGRVAERIGGKLILFNPVAAQIREYERGIK